MSWIKRPYCAQSDVVWANNINPRPDGGGALWAPPGGFSSITQIRLGIALWNFQYLSDHQFYASSEKILPEVTQGQKL